MSKTLAQTSPFFSANIVFISELYQKFLQNPASVDASWAEFFKQNAEEVKSILADYQGPTWAKRNLKVVAAQEFDISSNAAKEVKKDVKAQVASVSAGKDLNMRIANLISSYKRFGHLAANLDPIGLTLPQYVAEIDPKNHGLEASDLEKEVDLNGSLGLGKAKISQAIEYLNYI